MGAAMTEDEQHLRLLSILHYVYGVLQSLFVLLFGVFLSVWLWAVTHGEKISAKSKPPPPGFFWFIAVLSVFALLWMVAVLLCTFLTGRWIAQRRNRLFCIVVAAINCTSAPFGTVLGVFANRGLVATLGAGTLR
jgi:hypothetical protein